MNRGWIWFTFSEPLIRSDWAGLMAVVFGLMGWMFGAHGFLSHFGALCAGMGLGLVFRDRQQRAYERCLTQQRREHDALLDEIIAMDFDALVQLNQMAADRADPVRICPRCHRKTYNHTDISQGYCGACHDRT